MFDGTIQNIAKTEGTSGMRFWLKLYNVREFHATWMESKTGM